MLAILLRRSIHLMRVIELRASKICNFHQFEQLQLLSGRRCSWKAREQSSMISCDVAFRRPMQMVEGQKHRVLASVDV